MGSLAITTLSSKGHVVIPEEIRQRLGFEEGTQFIVVGNRDVVILKAIARPATEQFADLTHRAHAAARRAGMKRGDVGRAIKRARATR